MQASLPAVDAIDRNRLENSRGRAFEDFKRELEPRWWRVWMDIGAGYLAIAGSMVLLAWLGRRWPALLPLWIALGAAAFGYCIAFVQLFLHEAAHFNVAPGRRLNDLLANLFLGLMVGQDVRLYRTVHFDHHRYLGTPQDTERSYFDPLNLQFILEGLLGIKMLSVLRNRAARVEVWPVSASVEQAELEAAGLARRRRLTMLGAGVAANLAVIAVALWFGAWAVAIAWPLGMGSVRPLLDAVRQLLEHRDFAARAAVVYAATPHGAVTRMFGSGPIASTLGGAGFNRHLLHHWEPQISYTRLRKLEAFLLDTPCAPVFRAQTTTHARAFARLFGAA